jgi:phage terminase large subunit GpA-like protein
MVTPPERVDLWDQYIAMRQADFQLRDTEGNNLDPWARRSHQFYLDNRDAMDAGAVVSNPNRFENETLLDGSMKEVSAIQHYYNLVAKLGPEVVATEYDNDPPATDEADTDTLTALQIQRKVNGYDRGIIPPQCELVTIGVDVRKTQLHWTARAWDAHGSGHTIYYGIHDVIGTIRGSDDGLDVGIHNAILSLVEKIRRNPFCKPDGEIIDASLILIDAGYRTDAVYGACHKCGVGVMPIMGFGRSSGCTQANFSEAQRATVDKRPGDGWFLSRKGRLWLVCADADRWKAWEHDRWRTDADRPGSMQVWGRPSADASVLSDDETAHQSYAKHIVSEQEIEELHKGSLRRRWKAKGSNNHWLDSSYYASVAMSIRGLRIQESAPSKAQSKIEPSTRPSLKDLAGRGRK